MAKEKKLTPQVLQDRAVEVNFDGLVGPTHNYSGLSYGNIPSEKNQNTISNPKEAALQGLEKMKFLADMGVKQAVFPPQERPFLPALRNLGFTGADEVILKTVLKKTPKILHAVGSASPMWTANAATVSPSIDSVDKHVHFTPANLSSKLHRSIEYQTTSRILKAIFNNNIHFVHHDALIPGVSFTDEGAANHCRFCKTYGDIGIQLFIYGGHTLQPDSLTPKKYPARQSHEASAAIVRLHQLFSERFLFVQQSPKSIDAGAFHSDLVAVNNKNIFFLHEEAFLQKNAMLENLSKKMEVYCDTKLHLIEVKAKDIPLQDAIDAYLFNSQIISLPNGSTILLSPQECQHNDRISAYLENLTQDKEHPIDRVHYINLRQSMQNGGGPACLRLRVPLTHLEIECTNPGVFLDERLYTKLKTWITKHYRDRLTPDDLADPKLLQESRQALDELTKILNIGSIYDFQETFPCRRIRGLDDDFEFSTG